MSDWCGNRYKRVGVSFFTNKLKLLCFLGIQTKIETNNKWIKAIMKEGAIIKGRIVDIKEFGALLEIMPGLEGIISCTQMTWSNQAITTKEYFKLNEEYTAKIIGLNRDEKRMYLSIKQLTDDPWREIQEKYLIRSRHIGYVIRLAPYGIFVELEEGIGGMVLTADLSHSKKKTIQSSEIRKIGQRVEVEILNIDAANRKMTLAYCDENSR